ncbi:MAG: tetratricopeptide repeat protein [Eubacterium sp.]|nr:tetratricopeptide repeat protein [Eubacterium sp.]
MNSNDVWKLLKIEPTVDKDMILSAYRTEVVKNNPEDNPEGFKMLREAFEEAMRLSDEAEKTSSANSDAGEGVDNPYEDGPASEEGFMTDGVKTEFDVHMDKADTIYRDLSRRLDINEWEQWLSDPICSELDTADAMREKFLAYTMGHFQYPYKIWAAFDKAFNITEEKKNLVEMFPEEFINFIIFRAANEDFFDYFELAERAKYEERFGDIFPEINVEAEPGLFEKDKYSVEEDNYIQYGLNIVNYVDRIIQFKYMKETRMKDEDDEDYNDEEISQQYHLSVELLKGALENMVSEKLWHPMELAGYIRLLELDGSLQEAGELAEKVLFSDDEMLSDYYLKAMSAYVTMRALWEKCTLEHQEEEILERSQQELDKILSDRESFIMALVAKGMMYLVKGEMENASNAVIKSLDVNSRNNEAIKLLKKISAVTVELYEKKIQSGEATNKEKMELAWAYFRTENTEGVFRILDNIEPDDEIFYGYNNLYGRSLFNDKKFDEAYPYIQKWVDMIDKLHKKKNAGEELSAKESERLERTAFCYYILAACNEELGKNDEAIVFYKRAVMYLEDKYKDLNELLFYMESLGKLYTKMEDHSAALEVWNKILEKSDRCVPAYVHRQETAYELRNAQMVIDDYYNIIRDVPQYKKAYVLAAKVFSIYNQHKDVISVVDRAEKEEIDSDELRLFKAKALSREGKQAEAYELFKKIQKNVDEDETDIESIIDYYADIAYFLVNYRDENGKRTKLNELEKYLDKGFELDKKNKRLLWVETDYKEFTGSKADSVYKEMLEYYPDDDNIHFEYGEYLRRDKRSKEAEAQYKKCLKMNPEHIAVNNRLMDIYQDKFSELENFDYYHKSVAHATRQLEIKEDDYYRIERALEYIEGYEFEKAEQDCRRAIEIDPNNEYAYNALGVTFLRRRRFEEAEEAFKKAIEIMEDDETPTPFVNLSKVYESVHKYEDAIRVLQECIDRFGMAINRKEDIKRIYMKARDAKNALATIDELLQLYKEKYEKTKNKWYLKNIVSCLIDKTEACYMLGDEKKTDEVFNKELMGLLKAYGYLDKHLDTRFSGNDKDVASEIFRSLANEYLLFFQNKRKAIEYYKKSISMKQEHPVVDSYVKGLFKEGYPIVAKDGGINLLVKAGIEDLEDLRDFVELLRSYATACYADGNKAMAKYVAEQAFMAIAKTNGTVENYVSIPAVSPLRYSHVAMLYFLKGDEEKAMECLGDVDKCFACNFCKYDVCYDKIYILGRIAELKGDKENTIKYYRKCLEIAPENVDLEIAIAKLEAEN